MKRLVPIFALAALLTLACSSSALAAPPVISNVGISAVTETSATFEAKISPSKRTSYHFEYGPADCSLPSSNCTNAPAFDAKVDPADAPVPVAAAVGGLTPGTTYHYRLVARNTSTPTEVTESADAPFSTYHPEQTFEPCPNEAVRADKPAARLPDCRAYEQASPVDKNGGDARGRPAYVRAATDGDRIGLLATSPIPGAEGSQDVPIYFASRGGGTWSTQSMLPRESLGEEATVLGWTPDLSQIFTSVSPFDHVGGNSLLSRSSLNGAYSTLVPFGAGLHRLNDALYVGSNADGTQSVFESTAQLDSTPTTPGKPNLYLFDSSLPEPVLASVFNDGISPPQGAVAGPLQPGFANGGVSANSYTQEQHVVSSDGSVYFTEAGTGKIYLRRNPTEPQSATSGGQCTEPDKACTFEVTATEKTNGNGLAPPGSDAAGARSATFQAASADGERAFFTSTEKLTDDANTGPESLPPTIARADLPDGNGAALSFAPAHAKGIAIDGEYLYWANPEAHSIGRAKVTDAGLTEEEPNFILPPPTKFETHPLAEPGVIHTAPASPQYVTVDSGHLYWTDPGPFGGDFQFLPSFPIERENHHLDGAGTIGRAILDEAGPPTVDPEFIAGASNPQGIDAAGDYLYWSNAGNKSSEFSDSSTTKAVARAHLNPEAVADDVNQNFIAIGTDVGFAQTPQGLAVNASHIYVVVTSESLSQRGQSSLDRYELDGDPTSRIELPLGFGAGADARGIALDADRVYVAQQGADVISQANLELEEPNLEFVTDAGHPLGLALDGEHIHWGANQENPPNPGNDLYRFDATAEAGHRLTDLTVDTGNPAGAQVQGVLGTSVDGSYVYFTADGDLDGSGEASRGNCSTPSAEDSYVRVCNLYVVHNGATTFIAPLSGATGELDARNRSGDTANWHLANGAQAADQKASRVSPDGKTLLFSSNRQLTSYDNHGIPEFYRYKVGDSAPACVSCNPTGLPPMFFGPTLGTVMNLSAIYPAESSITLSRNLSADGNRVFFETTDALVPADTNGDHGCPLVGGGIAEHQLCLDAYEWEAQGTGSCTEDIQGGGCLYLLSSGQSGDASYFGDASVSGDDAFIFTRSALVGQDGDQLYDLYDAHVNGGLASQDPHPQPTCESEGCRPAPITAPPLPSAGSATFHGPSDPKAKAPPKHRSKHRKKHHKRRHRHAGTTRRHHR